MIKKTRSAGMCTPRTNRINAVLLAVVVLIAVQSPASAGDEVYIDGVLHIRNGTEPSEGTSKLELEELWRVGADSDLLIGLPTRVAVDSEKRIHVLDAQLNQVQVFSPDGEHLSTLSREGNGPGEMRNPSDMIVEENGDVGIVQEYPGKVIRFDRNDNPLSTIFPGGSPEEGGWCVLMSGRARGDQLIVCGSMQKQNEAGETYKTSFMSSYDNNGSERANYIEVTKPRRNRDEQPRESTMLDPFVFCWDIGVDGRVYVAPGWEQYEIKVYKPGGDLDRIIEREYNPWQRTKEEKQNILKMFGVTGDGPPPITVEDIAPTISLYSSGVHALDNGELWIHTSRGNRELPAGILARYDVFDAKGHYRRQVEVQCPGDPWNDRLFFISDDRVVRVRRFVDVLVTSLGPGGLPEDPDSDDAMPAVICYQIKR